jgi:hypothetical protein
MDFVEVALLRTKSGGQPEPVKNVIRYRAFQKTSRSFSRFYWL